MAQFYTNFSEYTDASFKENWPIWYGAPETIWNETIVEVEGSTGGKVVQFFRPLGQTPEVEALRRTVPINTADGPTDILLRMRATRDDLAWTSSVFVLSFRSTHHSGTSRTAYSLEVKPDSGNRNVLYKHENGTWTGNIITVNSNTASFPQDAWSGWWWLRLQANGSTIRWRWWENTEPETWTASVTDSAISSGATLALIFSQPRITRQFDVFAVGTNGDPAPTSPIITGPEITSTTKLQQAQSLTITGSSFGSAAGDNGIVVISPTDGIDGEGAVTQEVSSWSATSLTIGSVALPSGYSPGGTAYLFVRNDALEENEAGYEIKVADFALRVNDTIRDTDSGGVVNETVEAVVIRGTAGNREVLFVQPGAAISAGVLEMTDSTLTVQNYNQTKHVALIGSGDRMALLPATVVDRNDD